MATTTLSLRERRSATSSRRLKLRQEVSSKLHLLRDSNSSNSKCSNNRGCKAMVSNTRLRHTPLRQITKASHNSKAIRRVLSRIISSNIMLNLRRNNSIPKITSLLILSKSSASSAEEEIYQVNPPFTLNSSNLLGRRSATAKGRTKKESSKLKRSSTCLLTTSATILRTRQTRMRRLQPVWLRGWIAWVPSKPLIMGAKIALEEWVSLRSVLVNPCQLKIRRVEGKRKCLKTLAWANLIS